MSQPTGPNAEPLLIPTEHALALRRLSHDLSNALEVVVQTTYLLQALGNEGESAQWLKMLDDGVQKTIAINLQLRTYLKSNSAQ